MSRTIVVAPVRDSVTMRGRLCTACVSVTSTHLMHSRVDSSNALTRRLISPASTCISTVNILQSRATCFRRERAVGRAVVVVCYGDVRTLTYTASTHSSRGIGIDFAFIIHLHSALDDLLRTSAFYATGQPLQYADFVEIVGPQYDAKTVAERYEQYEELFEKKQFEAFFEQHKDEWWYVWDVVCR